MTACIEALLAAGIEALLADVVQQVEVSHRKFMKQTSQLQQSLSKQNNRKTADILLLAFDSA